VLFAVGGGPGGRAWAFSPDKQKPLWTVKFDGDAVGVATSGSVVYVAGHYDYIVSKDSSCYQFCPGGPLRHHLTAVTADSGTLVHVGVRNGAGFTLIAGHHTSTFGGVFVRRPADSAVYALHGPLTQVFDRTAEAWRDRTIASVIPDSVARIEIRRGKASYALVRSGRKWLTPSGAAADSNAVRDFLTRFSPLEAIGFATAAQADSLDFRRPFAEVRLFTGSGGKPSVLLRVDSVASGVWLRPDSSSTIYGIESWNLAGVVPTAKSLLHEPPKAR
jgi:hypothetical protein